MMDFNFNQVKKTKQNNTHFSFKKFSDEAVLDIFNSIVDLYDPKIQLILDSDGRSITKNINKNSILTIHNRDFELKNIDLIKDNFYDIKLNLNLSLVDLLNLKFSINNIFKFFKKFRKISTIYVYQNRFLIFNLKDNLEFVNNLIDLINKTEVDSLKVPIDVILLLPKGKESSIKAKSLKIINIDDDMMQEYLRNDNNVSYDIEVENIILDFDYGSNKDLQKRFIDNIISHCKGKFKQATPKNNSSLFYSFSRPNSYIFYRHLN